MKNKRAKIAAAATVVGLGGLGGVALSTNHGVPPAGQQVSQSHSGAPLVTTASGAVVPGSQPFTVANETHPPIITRASGGVSGFDD